MYDIIIIGAGPAGMTAAIYAARREMKTLVIGAKVGGQMLWASEIENYPGFQTIKGFELISKMKEQAESFGVEVISAEAKKIEENADGFKVYTEQEVYEGRTIVATLGASPRRLAIPGEEEFKGKGIAYCANCDGPFYRNKNVAVIGGGNSALDAAEVLSKIAKQVYLIDREEKFNAFETLIKEVETKKNVACFHYHDIKEISGSSKVEKIKIADRGTKEEKEIAVDGVFIEIGHIAQVDLIRELVEVDGNSEVVIDSRCATKTPGLFAAGDITQVPYKQIIIAAGQGAIAALSAYQYLQLKEGKKANLIDRGHH